MTRYQRVTKTCGSLALALTVVYIAALLLAASDGTHRGIEVRIEVTGLALVVISLLGIVAIVGWLVDHANRVTADRIAAAVAEKLMEEMEPRICATVERVGRRTTLAVGESITGELIKTQLTEQIDGAMKRALTYGMTVRARGTAEVPPAPWPGHPGEHNGNVRGLRSRG